MPHPFDELDFAKTLRNGEQPTLLRRYRVVRELGHGGMGSVYLAEDTHLDGRLVAIKMPSALLARNKRAVADLKREATTAMELAHPAIVTLRSFEQSDEGVFLVMDYVEGETLEDKLAQCGTLTAEELVKLLRPVAEALDYAHGRRVIHRDLKPANILIDKAGKAYLTDFGIAREMKDTLTRVTGKQDTSGTLPYMSPEQVNGENPTPAQDIYSFGALLYECLAGHPPFYRGQIEHQILNRDPVSLPDNPLAQHVMSCLAKAAGDRPGKAEAVFSPHRKAEPTTSHDRQGAAPTQAGAALPPDGSDSSEPDPPQEGVFIDLLCGATQPHAVPVAKPLVRQLQPYTAPKAPTPLPISDTKSASSVQTEGVGRESLGCFLSLVLLVLSAIFFIVTIWAATTAPGWGGVLRAILAGVPFCLALGFYCLRNASSLDEKDDVFGGFLGPFIISIIIGGIVVNFDSIKAWGISLIDSERESLLPIDEKHVDVNNKNSPHAQRPDEPIMVGETYAADLGEGVELVLTYIPSTDQLTAIRQRGFDMGSLDSEGERGDDEKKHRVILTRPFLMGVTEVTQEQWEEIMGESLYKHWIDNSGGGEHIPDNIFEISPDEHREITAAYHIVEGDSHPMYHLSWQDAVEFCERLTARERDAGRLSAGWSYRLPTEAEWEWACRAGTSSRYHGGPSENDLDTVGWYNRNCNGPQPVGKKLANHWGLYDMHGNVLEWCADYYGPYPEGMVINPTGPTVGSERIVRGGGWRAIAKYCRAARRSGVDPDSRSSAYGFRVVLSGPTH